MPIGPLLKLGIDTVLRLQTHFQAAGQMWVVSDLPFFPLLLGFREYGHEFL